NLTGSALSLTRVGAAVPLGQPLVLIRNDGPDPVVGTFAGLPQGAVLGISGQQFRVSYTGGDGNDVTLTAFGPPEVVVSADRGGPPTVKLFKPDGTPLGQFDAYGSTFTGGVRTALADV